MSYTPGLGPMGWVSSRYGHCYKRTTPSGETGMFLNINKNLTPRLQNKSPEKVKEEKKRYSATYYAYVRLLQRQKPKERTFTGEVHVRDDRARARTARDVGKRLHKAMSIYQPAESKPRPSTAPSTINFLVKKPVYTRSEVEAIFDKLCERSGEKKAESKSDENKSGSEETKAKLMKKFRKHQLYYPADEVRDAIEEFLKEHRDSDKSDDSKPTIHRQFSARSCAHAQDPVQISRDVESCENKRKKDDIKSTSDRLSKDEPTEEKENRRSKRAQSAPPERSNSRKVSKRELDEIIARLTKYDRNRWPPESRGAGRIVAYEQ